MGGGVCVCGETKGSSFHLDHTVPQRPGGGTYTSPKLHICLLAHMQTRGDRSSVSTRSSRVKLEKVHVGLNLVALGQQEALWMSVQSLWTIPQLVP